MATLIVIFGAAVLPQAFASVDRSRAWGAARYLASRVALARGQAAMRSTNVALRFEQTTDGVAFGVFVDGNGNGVRSRDIRSRVDLPMDPPMRLADLFPGVEIAVSEEAGSGDPVRIGSSRLLSFSPLGSATPGTIYVRGRDGSQLAVRVFGATGRTRVLRYVPQTRRWIPAF